MLSDLLGHRDRNPISAYVRIATETLRDGLSAGADVTGVTAPQLAHELEFLRFKRAMGIPLLARRVCP